MSRNIKLTIEYDGTNYSGWQIQPNSPTVQSEVIRAIKKMTGEDVVLTGSSRTDAGVHALSQVANFRTSSKIPLHNFLRGLNCILPEDISIIDVVDIDESFHAKRLAHGKHYRYILALGSSRSAIMRDRAWFVAGLKPRELSLFVKRINAAAKPLIGDHDFTSFCASGDTNVSKVRRLLSVKAKLVKKSDFTKSPLVHIDVTGEGFLKQMVRNIVGTLVATAKSDEKKPAEAVKKILKSKDRKKAGVTAPACGLYLVDVKY